eukprot:1161619-Pelagomonas_calceolata.AAC.4
MHQILVLRALRQQPTDTLPQLSIHSITREAARVESSILAATSDTEPRLGTHPITRVTARIKYSFSELSGSLNPANRRSNRTASWDWRSAGVRRVWPMSYKWEWAHVTHQMHRMDWRLAGVRRVLPMSYK